MVRWGGGLARGHVDPTSRSEQVRCVGLMLDRFLSLGDRARTHAVRYLAEGSAKIEKAAGRPVLLDGEESDRPTTGEERRWIVDRSHRLPPVNGRRTTATGFELGTGLFLYCVRGMHVGSVGDAAEVVLVRMHTALRPSIGQWLASQPHL